jgi:hypothetical protein
MTGTGIGTSAIVSDIDGALRTTGGADAMARSRAVEKQYGVPANINDCTEAGMPDQQVGRVAFLQTVAHIKVPRQNLTPSFCFGQ